MTDCMAIGSTFNCRYWRCRRNGGGQEPRHAVIAPIVHVKVVIREEGIEWNCGDLTPMAHDRTAAKYIDIEFLANVGKKANQCREIGPRDDLRCELRIDKHNVSLDGREPVDAVTHKCFKPRRRAVLQEPVSTELPDDKIRILRNDISIESRQHFAGVFAVDPAVENRNRLATPALLQLYREPGRIGGIGRTRARTGSRG